MPAGSKAVTAFFICGALALLLLERRRPLRASVEPGLGRLARNVAVGAVTAATVSAIERPIVERVSALTRARAWGVVPKLGLPPALSAALAIVLMDYTLYWWHVLLHRVPALWRAHEPHHIDRDLDMTTGVRFHFCEFLASIPWRCAQIVAIGVAPRTLSLWQGLTFAEVLFHHANLRLPRRVEAALSRFIVTPRLHGIHHSVARNDRDANFSSGLTVWDRLHGTARFDLDRDDVEIGLPGNDDPRTLTLMRTLALPFQRDTGPASGSRT